MTGAQGSGILKSMVRANGLIVIPEDREIGKAGERVKVQLLDRTQSCGEIQWRYIKVQLRRLQSTLANSDRIYKSLDVDGISLDL